MSLIPDILGSAGDGDLRDTILNIFKKVNPSSIEYCDPLSSGNVEPKKPPLIHQNENVLPKFANLNDTKLPPYVSIVTGQSVGGYGKITTCIHLEFLMVRVE